jgi:peptidoglycan/LPS O-acetylase OafA/YrhL
LTRRGWPPDTVQDIHADRDTELRVQDTAEAGPPSHYRPQLDGLRAIAVYLVVAFHAGIARFSAGFVGVDVFFVLSGYLVTHLLLRDLGSMSRIDLRRFYSRRFRRLLPAAFVALMLTAVVYVAVATPADAASALGGFRSAFLYVANWHFISQSNDYFAANVNTNPVLHFWSLAVEEQFYLFWPLLLSGLYAITRRRGDQRWNTIRVVVGIGMVASLVAALAISRTDLSRAYYGTDTRAYELLAGALLAMTPALTRRTASRQRTARRLAPVLVAGVLLVATSIVHLGAIQRGVAITALSCALILALELSVGGVVVRTLSSRTASYLGRVSYGTYLWHWPVIVIATLRFHPDSWALFGLTSLIATGLAGLSYELLERPIRISARLDRYRTPIIATGLAVSVVSGLVFVPAILHHRRTNVGGVALATSAVGEGWRIPIPDELRPSSATEQKNGTVVCFDEAVDQCEAVHGTKQRVLLLGDSHAKMLAPAFSEIARKHSMTLAVASLPNCAWQPGVALEPIGGKAGGPATCRARQDDWYQRILPQFAPDIVVVASRGIEDPANSTDVRLPDGQRLHWGESGFTEALQAASDHALQLLKHPGRKIVIIESTPLAPTGIDPYTCLSGATYLDDCRYVATAGPSPIVQYFRSIADGKSLLSLDLDHVVCPYFPICDPVVGGIVVKIDRQHLSAAYSMRISDSIDATLTRDGVLG